LYTEAIKIVDDLPEYYTNRAHALLKLERFNESKSDAQKATELDPQDSKAYLRKGIACFHLQQFEEALEAFQESYKHGGTCFKPPFFMNTQCNSFVVVFLSRKISIRWCKAMDYVDRRKTCQM